MPYKQKKEAAKRGSPQMKGAQAVETPAELGGKSMSNPEANPAQDEIVEQTDQPAIAPEMEEGSVQGGYDKSKQERW